MGCKFLRGFFGCLKMFKGVCGEVKGFYWGLVEKLGIWGVLWFVGDCEKILVIEGMFEGFEGVRNG